MIKYLFIFISSTCFGQNIINWAGDPETFTSYPNASNPNPELITGDAASLDPAENVDAITLTNQSPSNATRTSVSSDSGYNLYAREIEATSGGTLRRDRLRINSLLTVSEIYQLDVLHKCDDTTNNVRDFLSNGGDSDNSHAAHTDWQLHSYEFTADETTFEFDQFVRATSTTGQKTTYNISLKLKDD